MVIRDDTPEAREFAVRFYRWAQGQWRAELDSGFASLKAVGSDSDVATVRVLERWPATQLESITRASCRWAHGAAVRALGEAATPGEKALGERFRAEVWAESQRMAADGENRSYRIQPMPRKESRKLLWEAIRPALTPILGGSPENWGGGIRYYRTPIRNWRVTTTIDLGGRIHELALMHSVAMGPQPEDRVAVSISLQFWLGLRSGATDWSYLTKDEVPATADTVAMLCRRFVEAAPDLIPD